MAETEYATQTLLPIETIWEFVREMDNWAAFMTGYQRHEKLNNTDSTWTLKGDVGVLARTVEFRVHITEWSGPGRVAFTLSGVNEQLEGEGSFTLARHEQEDPAVETSPPRVGGLARLWAAVVRWLFRLRHGQAARGAHADVGPGSGVVRMTFRLRVDPGGPQAPMINAMMKPALLAAAENLSNRIITHLEGREGAGG